MNFETYLTRIPNLHTWDDGRTWNSGGFTDKHLTVFYDLVLCYGGENSVVLETGAGNSTITFLYATPKKLISIAPDLEIFDRIRQFCEKHEVDMSALEPRVERSEWALPELARRDLKIDLALIDGGHGWPTVFVDFCYIYMLLRNDGAIIIDDVQLHSVKELARLLQKDKRRFTLIRDVGKCLVFQKLTDDQFLPEWGGQPYIAEQSSLYAKWLSPFKLFD